MNTLGTKIFDLISDGVLISGETYEVESCSSVLGSEVALFKGCMSFTIDCTWHCRRQRATWIRKLGSIARRLKIE